MAKEGKGRGILFCLAVLLLLIGSPAFAITPPDPVKDYPEIDYINVTNALLRLGRLKPDNDDYVDAYAMAAHCDVVAGSYRDEFRWKQARAAMKKWIAIKKGILPTRLGVRKQILFSRYDFDSKYFLFAAETSLAKINTFTTNPRSNAPGCSGEVSKLLPSYYVVVTNNPINLPGLRLTEEQARDLSQKFASQNNTRRMAYLRFLVDITDSDIIGPTMFANRSVGDQKLKVKATLYAIEFFSDPYYQRRFYVYYPY
ncbi:MAG: DUF4852 domain-containing protein [Proteobacteria bacterium]|nr:DUF4852 domain-containing protein [Pseudomonadota bacterium]